MRLDRSSTADIVIPQLSYLRGLGAGLFPIDPADTLRSPLYCKHKKINSATTSAPSSSFGPRHDMIRSRPTGSATDTTSPGYLECIHYGEGFRSSSLGILGRILWIDEGFCRSSQCPPSNRSVSIEPPAEQCGDGWHSAFSLLLKYSR